MRCERMKRRISEDLDGRLSGKGRVRLEAHLKHCGFCRAYRTGLEKIQAQANRPAGGGPGPEYFAASLVRLRSRLAAEAAPAARNERRAPAFAPHGRWAWAGAASLLLAAVAVFFSVSRTRTPLEFYSLAFDEPLASFEHRIADNPEVASDFDKAVRTSLQKSARSRHAEVEPFLADHVLQVESLTDDEVLEFDSALQSELSRTQGRI